MGKQKHGEQEIEGIENLYQRNRGKFDANAIVLRSVRLVSLVKAMYDSTGDIREVMYIMADEQGMMLSEEQIISMVNKGRRKRNRILPWNQK